MEQIGMIERPVIPDLFPALISTIVGQQISTKAQKTVWERMLRKFGTITPEILTAYSAEEIQSCGISMRKIMYIKEAASKIVDGKFDIEQLSQLSDEEVKLQLSELKGIGIWTAEMLMTFSMQRMDILSWDDLAIHRGLRMVYRHRRITRSLFDKYKRRYSPYASVASLYLWEIAGGAIPDLKDLAPLSEAEKKKRAKVRRKQVDQRKVLTVAEIKKLNKE